MNEIEKSQLVTELREAIALKAEVMDDLLEHNPVDEALVMNLILSRVVSEKPYEPSPALRRARQELEEADSVVARHYASTEPVPQCDRVLKHGGEEYRCIIFGGHPPNSCVFMVPDSATETMPGVKKS